MLKAADKFRLGDKVVWSLKGLGQLHPRCPTAHGEIVGFPTVLSVSVQWSHRKTRQSLHISFVEKLP